MNRIATQRRTQARATRYAAFLRAVNVRGHPALKMELAERAFRRAGARNVVSFLQSGNLLFDAIAPVRPLFARIRHELAKVVKAEPVIVFRKVTELRALVTADPFRHHVHDPSLKLYAVFLERKPRLTPRVPLVDTKEALELIGLSGTHGFVVSRPKPGKRFYGMPNAFVEAAIGLRATSRYWSTLARLVARADEPLNRKNNRPSARHGRKQ